MYDIDYTGKHIFPCKAEQALQDMELQEKEAQKYQRIKEICLERTYG